MIYRGIIIAKILSGKDMDYMFLDQATRQGLCSVCHNLLEQIPDLNAKIKRKKGDFFVTYDGFTLVSQKFKDFCDERHYPNLTYKEMKNMPGLYYFMPNNVFRIDTSMLHLCNFNECCNSFDSIVGGVIKAIDFKVETNDFICRSNFFMGSRHRKGPCIIVGLETAKKMRDFGLKDVYFHDVYQ